MKAILDPGGFPELWQRGDLDRTLWLSSYLATYLERDVRTLGNIGSLRDFDRFLRAVALRAGQLCVFSELARDVGIFLGNSKSLDFHFGSKPADFSFGALSFESWKKAYQNAKDLLSREGDADLSAWLSILVGCAGESLLGSRLGKCSGVRGTEDALSSS